MVAGPNYDQIETFLRNKLTMIFNGFYFKCELYHHRIKT